MPDVNTLEYLIVKNPAALVGVVAASILGIIFVALPMVKVLAATLGMVFATGLAGPVTL